MRLYAGPESIGCVMMARTESAPLSIIRSAALASVPAVSMMSSTMITFLPLTSPMMVISATSLAFSRYLWQMTIGTPRKWLYLLARLLPPMSGEAMTRFSSLSELMKGTKIVDAAKWSTGMSKNP